MISKELLSEVLHQDITVFAIKENILFYQCADFFDDCINIYELAFRTREYLKTKSKHLNLNQSIDNIFKEAITIPENFREYKIAYNDKVWNLKALCEELGLNYSTVHKRLRKYGWTLQKALDCKACEYILKEQSCNQLT